MYYNILITSLYNILNCFWAESFFWGLSSLELRKRVNIPRPRGISHE